MCDKLSAPALTTAGESGEISHFNPFSLPPLFGLLIRIFFPLLVFSPWLRARATLLRAREKCIWLPRRWSLKPQDCGGMLTFHARLWESKTCLMLWWARLGWEPVIWAHKTLVKRWGVMWFTAEDSWCLLPLLLPLWLSSSEPFAKAPKTSASKQLFTFHPSHPLSGFLSFSPRPLFFISQYFITSHRC